MPRLTRFIQLLILFSFSNINYAQIPLGHIQNPRLKVCINQGWKFHLGDPQAEYFKPDYKDTDWKTVHVPHTLELTSLNLDDCTDDKTQETFHRNVGWYRKVIFIEGSDRKVFLEFEGAHQVTDLWINGVHVGEHAIGGYTPFHFDITSFANKGENNLITLLVDNRKREDVPPDPGPFDYIKFSGLYRDVYQVETNPVRITFNWESDQAGLTFTTPSVDPVNGNATIDIKTVVKNEHETDKKITVVNRLIDRKGQVVLKLEQAKIIKAGQGQAFNQIGGLEDHVHFWSTDHPYLYRLYTLVYEDQKVMDGTEIKVGLRKFEHHPREGFLLNGKPIKLIGMNRHQNFAYIGDAVPNSLHYKDMLQFKELGFNVMRTAHYPQDDALIEACDELGILVYEEPPTWIDIGNDAWFDNLERATRVMVRNHRNHPSIVIWGAGINHRGYVPRMHYAAKQEDPTRLTASQSSRWTGWQTSGLTDIYGQMVYGPVEWYRHEPMLAMEGRDDMENMARYKMDPLLTGIIAWAAHDHYTFHPQYGNQRGRVRPVGVMSIFRIPYEATQFFPVELKDDPQLYIASQWEESTNEVVVYSNTQEVELLVNGKSLEKKGPSQLGMMSSFDNPPFQFNIDHFKKGSLTARGWIGSKILVEQTIFTPENPDRINLIIDTLSRNFMADGSDALLAYAFITDKNGTKITNQEFTVKFSIEGPATIIGDKEGIGSNPMTTRNGVAEVMVRAGTEPGKITLHAQAAGLQSATSTWTSDNFQPLINLTEVEPYFDVESIKVDLGSPEQLVQFDWETWNSVEDRKVKKTFKAFGGFGAELRLKSDQGFLRWLGEMNVMGKYGYAFGEGVLVVDEQGLILELSELPAGQYQLTTYHHAPRSNTDSMDPNKEKLKSVNILDIPYAEKISLDLRTSQIHQTKIVKLTEGKIIPETGPGYCTFKFNSNGIDPVKLDISGLDSNKNIWLNAFELRRFVN